MNARSRIAVLLGSLILVNLGHNIIPHHHHLDDLHSHTGCGQQEKDEHAGGFDDPTAHCHAFNGIEFVISSENTLNPEHQKLLSDKFPDRFTPCQKPLTCQAFRYREGGPAPYLAGSFGNSAGLRAPPAA